MLSRRISIIAVIIFFYCSYLGSTQRFDYLSIEALGRGGANYAVSNNLSSFFYNPAGLADQSYSGGWLLWYHKMAIEKNTYSAIRKFLTVMPASSSNTNTGGINMSSDITDILKMVQSSDMEFDNVGPPLVFGYAHRYYGILWYTEEYMRIRFERGRSIIIPFLTDRINITAGANSVFIISVATKYKKMQFGTNIKYYEKGYATADEGLLSLLMNFNKSGSAGSGSGYDTILSSLANVHRENYATFDIGLKYWMSEYLCFGTAINDAWTFYKAGTSYNILKGTKSKFSYTSPIPKLSVGMAYYFDLPQFMTVPKFGLVYSKKTFFALDIQDITRNEDFLKKINFGFETEIKNFIRIRGGFSQGYPVFGFGIDFLKYYFFDYALDFEETGKYPGWSARARHIIRFIIKI